MKKNVTVKVMESCGNLGNSIYASALNGSVDIPFFFSFDESWNTFWVYAEEMKEDHRIGRIEVIDGKGFADIRNDEALKSWLKSLAESKNYSLKVFGTDRNVKNRKYLAGELEVSEEAQKQIAKGESAELSKAWKNALKLGGPFNEDYRRTVTEFFNDNKIPEETRLRIVRGYKVPISDDGRMLSLVKPNGKWIPTETENEKGIYFSSYAETALEQALDGNPVIFEGPKSAGKNFLAEWTAYVLGAVYYEISVDPDMQKSELYGDKVIDDETSRKLSQKDAEGYLRFRCGETQFLEEASGFEYWKSMNESMRFIVENTEFKRWLKQKSGRRLLMVNEINYGNPTILAVVFNRVAEDRPVRFIDVPGEGRIYIDRDCILTASMNRDYVGTMELNEAMRSRFGVIEMQPASSIKEILKDKIELEFGKDALSDEYYSVCDKLYAYMAGRSSSKKGASAQYGDKAISIRSFIRALRSAASRSEKRKKLLCSQLNLQLRGQCDTALERASLTADINEIIGEL